MILSEDSYHAFSAALLDWFAEKGRDLPWRHHYSAYHVWISEIMLQQTQMDRGVGYYLEWMRRFPDVRSVAEAPESDILKAWEGLGYYSRAKNLHKAAKQIMTLHNGEFPRDLAAIRALPGIGEYTAGAIASIAFEQNVPAVDANVERVFSRLLDIDTLIKNKRAKAYVRETVMACMPEGKARFFNQAVMELGALVCSKNPACDICPVRDFCEALRLGVTDKRPVLNVKPGRIYVKLATGVLVHKGRALIQKRPPVGIWADFWEFPGGTMEEGESPERTLLREFREETELSVKIERKIAEIPFSYTRYRATMHAFLLTLDGPEAGTELPTPVLHAATRYEWVPCAELDRYVFPSGHRKLLGILKKSGLLDAKNADAPGL